MEQRMGKTVITVFVAYCWCVPHLLFPQCSPSGSGIDPLLGVHVTWPPNPNSCCYRWTASGPGVNFLNWPAGPNGATLPGLAYGATYSYSIESSPDGSVWGGWCGATFTTVPGFAVNDEPCDAIVLGMGTTCMPLEDSLNGATGETMGSVPDNPPVLSFPDVWYRFVAGGPYTTIKVQSASSLNFQVYDTWCDLIVLNNTPWIGSVGPGGVGYINTDQFVTGATYYIRVYEFVMGGALSNAEFTICAYQGNQPNDCAGVPGGSSFEGSVCDDGDPCTTNDVFDSSCQCHGSGSGIGSSCDDGDPCTSQDVIQSDCNCAGVFQDSDEDGLCDADDTCPYLAFLVPGDPCDDGDPNTANDLITEWCGCQGTQIDCEGVIGGPSIPGTPCDDGNSATSGDFWRYGTCLCMGFLSVDCLGVTDGDAQPGTSCNDGDPCVVNSYFNTVCECVGGTVLPDTDDDGVCDEQDGCPNDPNKTEPGNCGCNNPEPGAFCDDNDPNTAFDEIQANCTCAGLLIDCMNIPGGPALPGTSCDDGDPCTTGDLWDLSCSCTGTPAVVGAGSINGPNSVLVDQDTMYSLNPVQGATAYSWQLPSGWTAPALYGTTLEPTIGGAAYVTVQLCITVTAGGCDSIICRNVTVDGTVGTQMVDSSIGYSIQPNPSTGLFTIIRRAHDFESTEIRVHDAVGREVMSLPPMTGDQTFTLDMKDAAEGVYYLSVAGPKGIRVGRLMIQR